MAENKTGGGSQFSSAVEALFQGMDHLVATKPGVGDAVRVDDAISLPLTWFPTLSTDLQAER